MLSPRNSIPVSHDAFRFDYSDGSPLTKTGDESGCRGFSCQSSVPLNDVGMSHQRRCTLVSALAKTTDSDPRWLMILGDLASGMPLPFLTDVLLIARLSLLHQNNAGRRILSTVDRST